MRLMRLLLALDAGTVHNIQHSSKTVSTLYERDSDQITHRRTLAVV